MKRYYAKPNTWFKEGTTCRRIEELWPGGAIYEGIYIVGSCSDGYDDFWYEKGYRDGDEVFMRELCQDEEFFVVDE